MNARNPTAQRRVLFILVSSSSRQHPALKKNAVCGCKVKLATLVKVDPKAPFQIVTSRCRGGSYSFPWIASLYP